jgi:DNA replication protein DnaC
MARDRKGAGDQGADFDSLVELTRQRQSTPGSSRSLNCKALRLKPLPTRHLLPEKDRSLAEIDPVLRRAIRDCVAGREPWPLVVLGPPGVGKTCAGLCLLDYAGGFYYQAPALAHEVIRAINGQVHTPAGRAVTAEQLWKEFARASLFVLDELGAKGNVNDWHYEQVKRLLDDREGQPTLVLSNMGFERLLVLYDDRVVSRLSAGTVVQLEGADRRLNK